MATINFTNINFDEIKADLKTFIKNTSDFNTYNFESSNLVLIVNLLSYLTNILSFYINQGVNEFYIDSVRLRKNLLSIVKSLNYLPARTNSSYVYVNLIATPTVDGTDVIIPRYSLFTAGEYNFYNTEQLIFEQANNYLLENIKLTEGIINQVSFTGDGTEFQEYKVENTAMGDYLRVWGYELDEEGNETSVEEDWDLYTEILSLPNPVNAKIYFLEEIETGYKISFGNGSFGYIPVDGHTYSLDYLVSSGADADELSEDQFSFSGTGTNLDSLTLEFSTETGYATTQSFGGADKESIDSIKFNAPKFYNSQGRAVTDDDYLAIILRRADVSKANVIGGENLSPQQLGKVYIYAKPASGLTFSNTELTTLRNYLLNYSVKTINPIVNNPDYIYFDIDSTIRYTGSQPSSTSIINDLDTYINSSVQEFETYFKYSKFIDIINDADSLIASNLTTLKKYRLITDDDVSSGDDYSFYLTKYLATSGIKLYIEEWTKDPTPVLNNTINEGDLTSLSVDTDSGLVTFTYSSFDFNTYTYKCYFNTQDNDIFTNFNQLLYLDTDNDLNLTFEKITL